MKSLYDADLAASICERLATGEPLAVICRSEGMPAVRTVSDWRKAYKDFDDAFKAARLEGADAIAAECLEIADDSSDDYKAGKDGLVFDSEHVQRSKLRIETRLKLLAKWFPQQYGEKQTVEHTGANGGAVEMITRIEVIGVEPAPQE